MPDEKAEKHMMSSVPRRIGKYELQELLGRGGMAEVWKASDTQLRRSVALKFMHANLSTDPGFVTRFIREAQTIAALRHPNIVQIYDFHAGAQDDQGASGSTGDDIVAYMVMEYIKGQTLAHYIGATSRKQEFPEAATLIRLFTPICLALDYAHQQGAIHRDIKPANILLDQNNASRNAMGEPILSDFGLAKVMGETAQTVSGTVLGTPLYMSPEQIQGKVVDPRSDLYSLAVILYEVCAGLPPFRAESLTGIMMQHLTEPPPAPNLLNPTLPAALTPVLMKSLAKAPTDRYPSATAMLAAVATAFKTRVPDEIRAALDVAGHQDTEDTIASSSPNDEPTLLEPTVHADKETMASSGDEERTILAMATGAASGETHRAAPGVSRAETAIATPPTFERVQQKPRVRRQISPAPSAPSEPTEPPRSSGQRALGRPHGWRLAVAAVILVALIGSGIGVFVLLANHHTGSTAATIPTVGQAYFVSSGQVNQDATQGINDEFQINLQGIPAPAAGKAYYAWLLPDANNPEGADILLGKLSVVNGAVNSLYPGDGQHANLLAITSRFLITEESASEAPLTPSPNLGDWKYYAALPQTIPAGQKYSLLDHLRHLLATDPDLEPLGLHGGLNVWNYRETQQVAQWALSARNDWNAQDYDSLRNTLIMMLDYLDGSRFVGSDVPAGTPILADQHIAQVGLLEFDAATQNPPGYLYHIALHVNGVLQSPGSTAFQRALAGKIDTTLANVKRWLGEARHDAVQMVGMDDAHLAQASTQTLLDDLVSVTTNAMQGYVNPTTHQLEDGVSQLSVQIQHLANLAVKPYQQ